MVLVPSGLKRVSPNPHTSVSPRSSISMCAPVGVLVSTVVSGATTMKGTWA